MSQTLHPIQPLLPDRIENSRSLLAVLILIAFLAGLALLFSRGAHRLSDNWRSQLTDTATVQILHSTAEARQTQIDLAIDTLRNHNPDAKITPLSQQDAAELIKPWIGETPLPDDLTLPTMITITDLNIHHKLSFISDQLEDEGLIVIVEDHSQYAGTVRRTSTRLVTMSLAALLTLLFTGLAASMFAARAGLSSQRDIISVLVQVGASDSFIAKLFVRQAGERAFIGSIIGLMLAGLVWLIMSLLGQSGGLGWIQLIPSLIDLVWMAGVALLFTIICAIAAGLTVKRQLNHERRRA